MMTFAIIMFYLSAFVFVASSIVSVFCTNKRLAGYGIKGLFGSLAIAAFSIILIANVGESNNKSIETIKDELSKTKLEYTKLLEEYDKLVIENERINTEHSGCADGNKQLADENAALKQRITQLEEEWKAMDAANKELKKKLEE